MNRKQIIKTTLIASLVLLSLGGWLLHIRTHPPLADADNLIPYISGIISIIIIPLLFCYKPTVAYAYVINGMLVILGTITMAHFSIVNFNGPLTLSSFLFKTTIPDILLLWGKFAVGKTLFDLELLNTDKDVVPKGRYFRYPNTGWWIVHLFGWSAVYALGNILWK